MNFFKNIFRDTAIYSLITFLGKFINYLLIPFLSKYICPADNGIISVIYAYIAILGIIYSYGMEVTFFRFGIEKSKKIKTLIVYTTIFFSITTFLFLRQIPECSAYALLIILILSIDTLNLIPFAELKNDRNLKKYSILKFSQTLMNVILIVIFIKFFKLEAVKFYLVANIIANLIVFPFLKPIQLVKVGKREILDLLSFALPLMFVNLIGEINGKWSILSLRIFLPNDFYEELSKSSIIGIVSMNCRVATAIGICIQAFRSAFDAMIFKKENDSVDIHKDTMHYFIIVISFFWFALSVNKDLIATIFFRNEIYKQGLIAIPFMGFYHMCNGIYYNISIYFKKINKTIYNFLFAIVSLLTNICLSAVLIPHLGYIGSFIANISGIILAIILSYWKNTIKYSKKDVMWILIPLVLICLHDMFVKSYLVSILLTIFYFCCVLLFLYKNDTALRGFVMSKLRKS